MLPYQRVFIIGGTGFLGYHAIKLFLKRGYQVTVLALPPIPAEGLFPPEVKIILADVSSLSDYDITSLLSGQDALVFAAGADDRTTPQKPAYAFFHHANVVSPSRLFRLARQAGVHRGVVLSSYFTHFARVWPEQRLADHHPYIRSRLEQEKACLAAANPDMALMILQLPYIFGSMPARKPLWAPLVQYLRSPWPLFYTRGGTNCVSVEHVAEAIVGAVQQGVGGERYLVGDENLTWADLLCRLCRAMGKTKRVLTLPNSLVRIALYGVRGLHHLQGREGGLEPVAFLRMQTAETYFDPAPAQKALGFTGGGLDQAFHDTLVAC